MKRVKHWQDPVNAFLGGWLLLSPWVLGFQGVVVATVSTTAVGVLLIASSLGRCSCPRRGKSGWTWSSASALMLAPILLGFDQREARRC